MANIYEIEVDCANCANLMEAAIRKVKGVQKADVSFMTQKLKLELCEGYNEKQVLKEALKECKKIEDDCEIYF